MRNLRSAQTLSFSIHQTAERQGVSPAKIEKNYDRLEKQMLREFYAFVKINAPAQFLHWNMRDINYGFQAIAHRFRVLGGKPIEIADDRKFDLARLLIDIYGIDYAPNPRLPSIMEINSIGRLAFMTGEEEARAFENRNYVGLHQSTLRKVDVMHGIADRVHTRKLLTNTSWWQMHGGRFIDVINWIIEHKGISFLIAAVGLGAAIFTLFRG